MSTSLLVSYPDELWLAIAAFLPPPDAYNLCLTSRRFHAASAACGGEKRAKNDLVGGQTGPVLAKLVMRAALLASIRRVLPECTGTGSFSPETLAKFPTDSVVLSGSVMVRACLGESWDCNDVDLYCTVDAAPAVRSMLVKEGDYVLRGINPDYLMKRHTTHRVGSSPVIQHVERYQRTPATISVDGVSVPYDREKAVRSGKGLSIYYGDDNPVNYGFLGKDSHFGMPYEWRYPLRPLPGDDLPHVSRFDQVSDEWPTLDLVVHSPDCKTVAPSMRIFDLTICVTSWDGNRFYVPEPHLTFNRKTRTEPVPRDLMRDYLKYCTVVDANVEAQPSYHPLHLHRCLEFAVGMLSLERSFRLFLPPFEPHQAEEVLFPSFPTLEECIELLDRLFTRLGKYSARGVDVIDAPLGATEIGWLGKDYLPWYDRAHDDEVNSD